MAKRERKIRVLLVDDHDVVRTGLKMVLTRYPGIQVVGEAADVDGAVALAISKRPDVVLLDLRLKQESGLEVCRKLRERRSKCRVLILTAFADESLLLSSMLAGAHGYVLKEVNGDELFAALLQVAQGEPVSKKALDELFPSKVSGSLKPSGLCGQDLLTAQERRLMDLVGQGKTNLEIGQDLGLREESVKAYLATILDRLTIPFTSQTTFLFQTTSQDFAELCEEAPRRANALPRRRVSAGRKKG
ncbi:MAG: response regulator transcription factor [Lentisphaerota bacterium]